MECFISGIKEEIRAQVVMRHPATWLEATMRAQEVETIINSHGKSLSFTPRSRPSMAPTTMSTSSQPLKVEILSPTNMEKCQQLKLCYNFYERYVSCHKCKEQNIFRIDVCHHPVGRHVRGIHSKV